MVFNITIKSLVDRTIYIDKFHCDHDHDTLRHLLSEFGKVTLVSLPRFDSTRQFKGFGFVEFENPEAAREAMITICQRLKDNQNSRDSMRAMMKKTWLDLKAKMNEILIMNPASLLDTTTAEEVKNVKRTYEVACMESETGPIPSAKVRKIDSSDEDLDASNQL